MVWTDVSSILRLSQTWFESEAIIVHTFVIFTNLKPKNAVYSINANPMIDIAKVTHVVAYHLQ